GGIETINALRVGIEEYSAVCGTGVGCDRTLCPELPVFFPRRRFQAVETAIVGIRESVAKIESAARRLECDARREAADWARKWRRYAPSSAPKKDPAHPS